MFRFSTFFRSHGFHYSTLSTFDGTITKRKSHLLVDYLMDSLRFSKQDAISISTKAKLTHLKSTINSDLVVNILKTYGLDLSQIRQIVSSAPKILTCKANKTLKPKIRVFQELGLSGSDLTTLLRRNPEIFRFGLHTRIMPGLQLLRNILGSDENVIEVMNKSRWLYFTNGSMKRLSKNVSLLQNFGLLNERIITFILSNPDKLMVNPELLEYKLSYVEDKLGISRELPIFIHAVNVFLWSTDSEIEKKMQIFRSFGWSDFEIATLIRAQPYCLNNTEAYISDKLNFFMKELKYTVCYLMSHTSLWTMSLEKRIKPRNEVLKILNERELVKDAPSLDTIVKYSESKFLHFVQRFEIRIPGLCETYKNSLRDSKAK